MWIRAGYVKYKFPCSCQLLFPSLYLFCILVSRFPILALPAGLSRTVPALRSRRVSGEELRNPLRFCKSIARAIQRETPKYRCRAFTSQMQSFSLIVLHCKYGHKHGHRWADSCQFGQPLSRESGQVLGSWALSCHCRLALHKVALQQCAFTMLLLDHFPPSLPQPPVRSMAYLSAPLVFLSLVHEYLIQLLPQAPPLYY